MCIEGLHNWWYQRQHGIGKPEISGQVNSTVINETVNAELDCNVYCSDHFYSMANWNEFNRMIEWDKTNQLPYSADGTEGSFDCDDFAKRLAGAFAIPYWSGLPFGELLVTAPSPLGAHKVNIFVDENLSVWIVEPQDDSTYRKSDLGGWEYHYAEFS